MIGTSRFRGSDVPTATLRWGVRGMIAAVAVLAAYLWALTIPSGGCPNCGQSRSAVQSLTGVGCPTCGLAGVDRSGSKGGLGSTRISP